MKKVIIQFETDEQAQRFFELFDDTYDEDFDKSDQMKRIINDAMEHCQVDSVNTKKGDEAYELILQ